MRTLLLSKKKKKKKENTSGSGWNGTKISQYQHPLIIIKKEF